MSSTRETEDEKLELDDHSENIDSDFEELPDLEDLEPSAPEEKKGPIMARRSRTLLISQAIAMADLYGHTIGSLGAIRTIGFSLFDSASPWKQFISDVTHGILENVCKRLRENQEIIRDSRMKDNILSASNCFGEKGFKATNDDVAILKLLLKLGAKSLYSANPLMHLPYANFNSICPRIFEIAEVLIEAGNKVSEDTLFPIDPTSWQCVISDMTNVQEEFQKKTPWIIKFLHLYLTNTVPDQADLVCKNLSAKFSEVNIQFIFPSCPAVSPENLSINFYKIYLEALNGYYKKIDSLICIVVNFPYVISEMIGSYLGSIDLKPGDSKEYSEMCAKIKKIEGVFQITDRFDRFRVEDLIERTVEVVNRPHLPFFASRANASSASPSDTPRPRSPKLRMAIEEVD